MKSVSEIVVAIREVQRMGRGLNPGLSVVILTKALSPYDRVCAVGRSTRNQLNEMNSSEQLVYNSNQL